MLSEKVCTAINEQINAETYSAYLYWSMAAWLEERNLPGFANWMMVQYQEEMSHAMKFYNYVIERGGMVKLKAIDAPPTEWDSPLAVFEAVYEHETKVTGLINGLVKVAREETDNATEIMLQWFVTEQVEEEASADALVQKLKLVQDAPHALFMIDKDLAARVFTPPAAAE